MASPLYLYSSVRKRYRVVVEHLTYPDVTDRFTLGLLRPCRRSGRHVWSLTEPEQLRGPVEAAFARPGHRGEEGPMTAIAVFVGIDVSKDRLDLALRPTGERGTSPNTERGIRTVCRRLRTCA